MLQFSKWKNPLLLLLGIQLVYSIGSFAFLVLGLIMNLVVLDKSRKIHYCTDSSGNESSNPV